MMIKKRRDYLIKQKKKLVQKNHFLKKKELVKTVPKEKHQDILKNHLNNKIHTFY